VGEKRKKKNKTMWGGGKGFQGWGAFVQKRGLPETKKTGGGRDRKKKNSRAHQKKTIKTHLVPQ